MAIVQWAENVNNAVNIPSQAGEEFVPVRRNGKNSAKGRRQVVMTEERGGGQMENLVRGSRRGANMANVVTSNRFRGLKEDTQSLVLRESQVIEANKENIEISNIEASGKRGENGVGIVFGAEGGKMINGPRSDGRNKKLENGKAHESQFNRSNSTHMAKPGKGLIFGPARDELALSVNSKRLRVEKDNMGRSGGSVIVERKKSQDKSAESVMQQDEVNQNMVALGDGERMMEETLSKDPSGKMTGGLKD
ncbi:unnamed protein product [Arabis nemorensis]|uniref:DUF4283 domain-containing protein n=1 Tax=Arabis nemorensis TaxID=586526 RepID=A0A565CV81_9BRAS|nr:unnamed protein product [Arabis nemorensis]